MTTADNSPTGLIAQLAETWGATAEVCRGLTPAQWRLPTACPGWSVKDQVVHIIGTESMLAGLPTPDVAPSDAPHVRNDIGKFNEAWITARLGASGEEILDELESVTASRLEALRAMPEEAWEEPSWTPVGQAPYRRFMQIRVFDCWAHEMDIKDALDPPAAPSAGQAAEQAVDEVERALGLLIGKRAAAPAGARVTLALTGPVHRDIHVAVNGRASVVDELDSPARVVLRMSSLDLLRLGCGRRDPVVAVRDGDIGIAGDTELGERILAHLPFTI